MVFLTVVAVAAQAWCLLQATMAPMVIVADMDPGAWGTVADWVAAVGTVATLFFALTTLRTELRSQRANEALQRADEDRHRKSQARRIVFSISTVWSSPPGNAGPPWSEQLKLQVTNHSDLPVYQVRARVDFGGTEQYLNAALVLSPGETRRAATPLKQVDEKTTAGERELFFVDACGVAWSRGSSTSDLEELASVPRDDKGWPSVDWPPEKDFELTDWVEQPAATEPTDSEAVPANDEP